MERGYLFQDGLDQEEADGVGKYDLAIPLAALLVLKLSFCDQSLNVRLLELGKFENLRHFVDHLHAFSAGDSLRRAIQSGKEQKTAEKLFHWDPGRTFAQIMPGIGAQSYLGQSADAVDPQVRIHETVAAFGQQIFCGLWITPPFHHGLSRRGKYVVRGSGWFDP
jgi:hypothetical protein